MNWEYISGFFDADGSITASSPNKGKNKTLIISFHNCEIGILQEIKSFIEQDINVKGHISCKKAKKETHSDAYDLKYSHTGAYKISEKLQSKHPKKRHRIQIYKLVQEKTKRNGKYSRQELEERNNLLKRFFEKV